MTRIVTAVLVAVSLAFWAAAVTSCGKTGTRFTGSPEGPQGPAGSEGVPGPQGPAGDAAQGSPEPLTGCALEIDSCFLYVLCPEGTAKLRLVGCNNGHDEDSE